MTTEGYIILFCWIIFLLYWIASARNAKPDKEVKQDTSSFQLVIIWLLFGGFLFLKNFLLPIPQFHIALLQTIGIVSVIIGLISAIIARKTLAQDWSKGVVLKTTQRLITNGIYNYTRHPIYSGFLLMALGTVLFLETISATVLFIIMFLYLRFKSLQEEKLLTKHFPKEYPEYKKRTKSLIPFIY